jgi:pimeloyl-ACP methyl ester carboxylesterase
VKRAASAVVGLVLAAAGAGVGIRHATKAGLSVATVSGLAALVVGLVLLGRGVLRLWRALGRWGRMLLVPAALVAVVPAWCVAFAVMATFVAPTPLSAMTPADRGLTYADVSVPVSDTVRLSAWWVPGRSRATVVLLHGAGENRTATLPQAQVLSRAGFGVLLLDARGHGRSGGRGTDVGWDGDGDVRAALDFLATRPDVDPTRIGLLGLSMGAEEAIGAAAADPRVRAVVAEGATARTAQDKADWLPRGVAGALQRAVDRAMYGLIELLTSSPRPTALRDAVSTSRRTPFLLITAGTEPDEARAARALHAAAPARVQVWSVERAKHTHALQAEPELWRQRVVGFLTGALS